MVEIPKAHNSQGTTAAALFKDAPHRQAAKHFIDFLTSETVRSTYEKYGFEPIRK